VGQAPSKGAPSSARFVRAVITVTLSSWIEVDSISEGGGRSRPIHASTLEKHHVEAKLSVRGNTAPAVEMVFPHALGQTSFCARLLSFEDALLGRGWFDSGVTLKNAAATGETLSTSGAPIGTLVFACESTSGRGYTMASKVVISPARSATSDQLDLKQPLEIAWFYWTDNPLLDYSAGSISFPGGRVVLDSGVYKLTTTARRTCVVQQSEPATSLSRSLWTSTTAGRRST